MLYPPVADLGRRNRVAFVLTFAAIATIGSGGTVLIALFGAWALISIVVGRLPFRLSRSDWPVALSCLVFPLVLVATNLLQTPPLDVAAKSLPLLTFLIPVFLIARMRMTEPAEVLPAAFLGAAIGGLVLLPLVIGEAVIWGDRVAVFAGNPGPFSVTSLFIAGLAALHLSKDRALSGNLLALAGCFGASLAVVLSGMRGSWVALPIVLAVAAVARRAVIIDLWRAVDSRRRLAVVAAAAGCLILAGALAVPAITARIAILESDLSLLETDVTAPTSLNLRRNIYWGSIKAFAERPLTGYGMSHEWAAITPYFEEPSFKAFEFSHLHNVFLTVAIDAGIFGIAALIFVIGAPLWIAWHTRDRIGGGDRAAYALILVAAFLIPGMTNLMFFHDILDAVWVFAAATLCASVPVPRLQASEGATP
ncbi:O-antigen ligase family protein [Mangrovicella endophytica]|uniref:O-antigen ligase family protein n=1 Tax=Mangrovicella endophytica TaxID=2066697 RepID=UPI000C9EBACD|nr:O-antigen ligase family protein [Mangrovicella endophytica]